MRKTKAQRSPVLTEEEPNSGAHVSTRLEGTPDEIQRAHKKLSPNGQPIEPETESTDKDEKFFELLDTTQGCRVIAQRRKPLQLNDKDLKNRISVGETPLDMLDIENTIAEELGGTVWSLSIIDRITNRKIAGKTLEILEPAKPVYEESSVPEEPPYNYPSQEEMEEVDPMKLMTQQMTQRLKFKQLQKMMKDADGGEDNVQVQNMINQAVDKFNINLNATLDRFKSEFENRLRTLESDHGKKEHMTELATMKQEQLIKEIKSETREMVNSMRDGISNKYELALEKINTRIAEATKKSPEQDSMLTKFLEMMGKSTDHKISSLNEQQKNTLSVMETANKGNAEMVKTLIAQVSQRSNSLESLRELLNLVGGAQDVLGMGKEPLDMGSRIVSGIETLGPQVLNYLKGREDKTKTDQAAARKQLGVDIVKKLNIADQVKEEIDKTPNPKQLTTKQGEPTMPSVEASIRNRVENTMRILLEEVAIRPRSPQWVTYAMEHLPENILEELAKVANTDEALNLLKKYVEPKTVTNLIGKIALDAKAQEWVKSCFEMLISACKEEPEIEKPEPENEPETEKPEPPAESEPVT